MSNNLLLDPKRVLQLLTTDYEDSAAGSDDFLCSVPSDASLSNLV